MSRFYSPLTTEISKYAKAMALILSSRAAMPGLLYLGRRLLSAPDSTAVADAVCPPPTMIRALPMDS
ncbi:MAG: hypothetical protein H6Q30_1838 [Bacteroidetes bacterium]|nr:hypothetical protein [Bacteroidota bacterium]